MYNLNTILLSDRHFIKLFKWFVVLRLIYWKLFLLVEIHIKFFHDYKTNKIQ